MPGPVRMLHHTSAPAANVTILGVPIDTLDISSVVQIIGDWIKGKENHYVCVCDVHSVICAQDDELHMHALCSADLALPDGIGLVWVGQLRGYTQMRRVCGADLLRAVCASSVDQGWRHYFLGGEPGVSQLLATKMAERYPGLAIVGTDSPPFRPPSANERQQTEERIHEAKPDIIWVGLGCPKQERWMLSHCGEAAVLIGIGAAFDFESGRIKRAPVWMQVSGLEWAYHLISEPRRLWRRYFYCIPRFIAGSLIELIGARPAREPPK